MEIILKSSKFTLIELTFLSYFSNKTLFTSEERKKKNCQFSKRYFKRCCCSESKITGEIYLAILLYSTAEWYMIKGVCNLIKKWKNFLFSKSEFFFPILDLRTGKWKTKNVFVGTKLVFINHSLHWIWGRITIKIELNHRILFFFHLNWI